MSSPLSICFGVGRGPPMLEWDSRGQQMATDTGNAKVLEIGMQKTQDNKCD